MHLVRASASRPKAILVRAIALVPLPLESFEEGVTNNIHVYQANASTISVYSFKSVIKVSKRVLYSANI